MPSNAIISLLISLATLTASSTSAQHGQSTVVIQLENNKGGYYAGQKVSLISKVDGKIYSGATDVKGEVSLDVPCHELFDLAVPNYTKKTEIES
ncbi:MAG: hypothetical protein ACOYXT_04520, partial [Bacteroidota bacterium]